MKQLYSVLNQRDDSAKPNERTPSGQMLQTDLQRKAQRVRSFLSHFFDVARDAGVEQDMAEDWLKAFMPYPVEAVEEACDRYLHNPRRSEAGTPQRPHLADMLVIIRDEQDLIRWRTQKHLPSPEPLKTLPKADPIDSEVRLVKALARLRWEQHCDEITSKMTIAEGQARYGVIYDTAAGDCRKFIEQHPDITFAEAFVRMQQS